MKSNKNNIKTILPNHLNSDILCLQNLMWQARCTRQILTIHVFFVLSIIMNFSVYLDCFTQVKALFLKVSKKFRIIEFAQPL